MTNDADFGSRRPNTTVNLRNFVAPEHTAIVPSRHEVIDPYANSAALAQADMRSVHTYTPIDRAWSMLVKTTAVTVALAMLTMAALFMLDSWTFLAWIFLASVEWCAVFCWLALLDFRETPAAHLRQKTQGYLELMRTEQKARLWKLYGWEE